MANQKELSLYPQLQKIQNFREKKKRKYKGKENKMENKQSQGYTKTLKDRKL